MKKMKMAALALILVLGGALKNEVSAQYYEGYDDRDQGVTYQDFYDELDPYGRWVEYPGQGYVWVPEAEPDFQPYSTKGHWVWTDDYEWMWVSDYDWGWAPFHYGRWDYDNYYGWYWVPGYEWSPAWVAWRDGGDYYGWAPIRPGINISINFNIGGYSPPYNFWCFAPRRYITSPRIYDYYLDRRQNVTIINQTNIIVNNFRYGNNYGFRSGPRRYDAEVYCGRINPVRFRQSNSPGRTSFRNNEVNLYRPNVSRDNNRSFAPRQFERYDRNNGGTFRNNNGGNRNDNTLRRDNAGTNRRPDSRDRVDNSTRTRENNGGFRREENTRQPNADPNTPNERGRFDRNGNNPGRQPVERRMDNPRSDPNRSVEPGAGRPNREPAAQPDNRGFERRNMENPGRSREMRTQESRQPQMERRQPESRPQMERRQPESRPQMERRQPESRPQMERRQPDSRPQMERRQPESRPQPQMERRQESRPQQQMERRQEQPQQQQRSFERRSDNGGNNGNGGGNGKGRGGRF